MTNTSIPEEHNLILANCFSSIDDACRKCPTLDEVLELLSEHGSSASTGAGLLINTEYLKGLKVDTMGRCALVLALPDALEPLLPKLLNVQPTMFYEPTLDLKQAIPVLRWYPEGTVKVLVDLVAVNSVIGWCSPQYWETDTRIRVPVPIVMLAGNSIGLGGIVTARDWKQEALRLERYTKYQYQPEHFLDEETRQESIDLAQREGPRPWSGRLWSVSEATIPAIHIPVYLGS
ncbi:hypothetical protein ACSBPU_06830 [Parapusillimonas sp. JC17]|uniref:hypothetical protein n=1 Tax=Parapusillimonas sp. JC17 TaxID=3445768 RepID=UPI003F9F6DC2